MLVKSQWLKAVCSSLSLSSCLLKCLGSPCNPPIQGTWGARASLGSVMRSSGGGSWSGATWPAGVQVLTSVASILRQAEKDRDKGLNSHCLRDSNHQPSVSHLVFPNSLKHKYPSKDVVTYLGIFEDILLFHDWWPQGLENRPYWVRPFLCKMDRVFFFQKLLWA
jgi:hypothetical protein